MAAEQAKFAGAFKDAPPQGFDSPISLPASAEQQAQWQQANRSWWEKNPMRYDWRKLVMRMIPDALSRLVSNRLKLGTFLVSRLRK